MTMSLPIGMEPSTTRSAGARGKPAYGRRNVWQKTWAVLAKEFIQLRRDRMSFGMIVIIPMMTATINTERLGRATSKLIFKLCIPTIS